MVMHLFVLMLVHIEFRVCLFYCASHLCLLVIRSIVYLHSCLVCAFARSTSTSADVLIWAFIHLRSSFSQWEVYIVLVLFLICLHLVCCSKPSWPCWLELRHIASMCGQRVASGHVG